MAYLSRDWLFLVKGRPLNKVNFWFIGNNFYKNQDIALKFSAYVYQMSMLDLQKFFDITQLVGEQHHQVCQNFQ